MPKPLVPIGSYEADCEWDIRRDLLIVRVRRLYMDEHGMRVKKGFIFQASEELFKRIAEGMEYPTTAPESSRFTKLVE